MKNLLAILLAAIILPACQPASVQSTERVSASKLPGQAEVSIPALVTATGETTPTQQDGANDPAIWVDSAEPKNSLILGSASEGGIEIYSLDGNRVHTEGSRPISLIDVLYNFPLGGRSESLVVAYDTSSAELVAYTLNAEEKSLTEVSTGVLGAETEIEGLCLYHSALSGKYYAFAAGGGFLQQWELYERAGKVAARKIRTVPVGLGAAQCVVQNSTASLFLAQETVGVWLINAEPESEAIPQPIDLASPFGKFTGDVKGVELFEFADGGGYLLVSDADVSLVQVYDLNGFKHVATIGTEAGAFADAADETEGLAASSMGLSDAYPLGLLVLSDDDNDGEHTNYKLVSWQDVANTYSLNMGLPFDPGMRVEPGAITVSATVETEPVSGHGDAADDPAIWVHPTQPELSLIIGTQKKLGINVYDLSGALVQSLPDGRLNNADLRYGFVLDGEPVDILTASNRTTDSISIYAVDPQRRELVNVADGVIPTGMADPYGLCMYRSAITGNTFVFVNDTDGVMKQWQLQDNGNGKVGAQLVREFSFDSQTEGCVADDETGMLYVGEEDVAIWKMSAEPDAGESRSQVDTAANGNLTDDVEGLAMYYGPGGSGYLVASNQGADNYALYEREGNNRFLGIFHIVADEETGIDGASETDGLDVTSVNLGPAFPNGVLVVQDGRNITPDERQNFKLVPWERVAEAFGLPLQTGYDPRAANP